MARPKIPAADEKQIRRLLERYACPVPYHEVRTRLLGNIAAPVMSASPLRVIQDLWGGELPEFEDMDDANELIGALVNGMWNALTRHQKRTDPFRLTRVNPALTRQGLCDLALIRRQELDGFVEGLFSGQDSLDLPQKAKAALNVLADVRSMMAGVHEVAKDDKTPSDAAQIEQTFRHVRELAVIMEKEINVVVLDCTRSRRQSMSASSLRPPTIH